MWHLCLYPIGQNVVTWSHLAAREAWKCLYSRQLWVQSKLRGFVTAEEGRVDLWWGTAQSLYRCGGMGT